MYRNEKIYWIITLIIFTLIAIPASMFITSIEEDKIDTCVILDHTKEAYYECLEQNSLDTWDMANKALYLKITFWGSIFIIVLLLGLLNLIFYVIIFDP